MKKCVLLMLCCIMVFSLGGCIGLKRGSQNEFRSDEDLADEMAEKIVGCIEAEDADAFTELFSESVRDGTPSLKEQAEKFIEFYHGKAESCEGNASSSAKSEYGETVLRELKAHYTVITDEEQYEIAFIYCPLDSEEPDKVGLTAAEITTEETFGKEGFHWSLEAKPGIYVTDGGEEQPTEETLSALEEWIREARLTEEPYRGADLEALIEGDVAERTAAYTENVHAIAFLENRVTDTECVYYDLADGKRYRTSNEYLFSDLSQAEPEDYEDGQQIVEALDKYGVFSWESGTSEEGITDPQYMVLAVEYEDGTVFRVKASGLLSQVLPDEYDEVREMLLSGEYS